MSTEVRLHRTLTVLLAVALLATLSVALTGGHRADAVEGPVDVVYVTTGRNFPDALAGGTLAATTGAPMLTVEPQLPIPPATVTALESLDPDRIVIFGGPVAVSDAVKDALGDHARSGSVTRIEGGDRHDTAAKIADALPDRVHDSERVGGLTSEEVAMIVGDRADTATWSSERNGPETVASVVVDAPTRGVAFISATVEVDNDDALAQTVFALLTLDWDGELTEESVDAAVVASHDLHLTANSTEAEGERDTAVMTTVVPLSPGSHTVDLLLSSASYRTRLENVSVVFSATGTATPRGTPGVS